jgi:hypothetical protein
MFSAYLAIIYSGTVLWKMDIIISRKYIRVLSKWSICETYTLCPFLIENVSTRTFTIVFKYVEMMAMALGENC